MKYILTSAFALASVLAMAQRNVVNEEINITKEREISIPKSSKLTEKITPVKNEAKDKKMNYSFYDRKPTGVEEVTFNPQITSPVQQKSKYISDAIGFDNYLKVGLGNYGRIYGETFINSPQNQALVYGLSASHNSTRKGPIAEKNSGQANTKIDLDGKYHQNNYEVKMNLGYENRIVHYYGYDTLSNHYDRSDLRQRFNLFSGKVTLENTQPKPIVDYKLSTGIQTINDRYSNSELDWVTELNTFFPIFEDRIKAVVDAEAYITQMQDNQSENPSRKRNLFRLHPGFTFDYGSFSAKIGVKVVAQNDKYIGTQNTKAYPSAILTYKLPSMIYVFGGYDGDVVRNTMRSLLLENPYLKEQMSVQNTYKDSEIFVGARGDLFSGLTFNVKGSFGKFKDLYYFDQYDGVTFSPNGVPLNTTKFDVVYDAQKVNFAKGSLEVGYNGYEIWKPNLKFDYYYYQQGDFEKPYHRPSTVARFGNNINITDRLVSTIDFYYMGGIFARNTGGVNGLNESYDSTVKLKNIADLNAEFSYLFTDQIAGFIKINNILGKNYQRFYNYPQQGVNFLVGINIAL